MVARILRRYKYVILYGLGLALLLFLFKWLEWRFLIFDHAIEVYSGAIAVLFTFLGIWLALKLTKPKTVTITVPAPAPPPTPTPAPDPHSPAIAKLGPTPRTPSTPHLMTPAPT